MSAAVPPIGVWRTSVVEVLRTAQTARRSWRYPDPRAPVHFSHATARLTWERSQVRRARDRTTWGNASRAVVRNKGPDSKMWCMSENCRGRRNESGDIKQEIQHDAKGEGQRERGRMRRDPGGGSGKQFTVREGRQFSPKRRIAAVCDQTSLKPVLLSGKTTAFLQTEESLLPPKGSAVLEFDQLPELRQPIREVRTWQTGKCREEC